VYVSSEDCAECQDRVQQGNAGWLDQNGQGSRGRTKGLPEGGAYMSGNLCHPKQQSQLTPRCLILNKEL